MIKKYKNPPSILWAIKHFFSFSYHPTLIVDFISPLPLEKAIFDSILSRMINLVIFIAILKEAEVQGCPSTVSLNRCDKKAIILVCNVWMNLYVGLCNIDFIKLMTIILV